MPITNHNRISQKSECEEKNMNGISCKSSKLSASGDSTTIHKKSWLESLNPFRERTLPPVPKEKSVTKECKAGFFNRLYFQWMTPLIYVGYKRQLHENDVWTINPVWATGTSTSRLRTNFEKQVTLGGKYPLIFALYETFKKQFWIGGLCQLVASLIQSTTPFIMKYLIKFAKDAYNFKKTSLPAPPIGIGLSLVFGITIMQIVQSLLINQFVYRGMIIGGTTRAALISLIFEKAMKISGKAKAGDGRADEVCIPENCTEEKKIHSKQNHDGAKLKNLYGSSRIAWGNGKVMSLMSVDTYRVDQASAFFHLIWTSPIACVVTLGFLSINLTYSALAGFGLLISGIVIMTKITMNLFSRRKNINKLTDERVSFTQEILQAVRFVKLFSWESAFLTQFREIRKREIRATQILMAIRNAMNTISISLPIFSSMLTLIIYSFTNHSLEPAIVFSSLALFNSLRIPLNLLPLVIGQTTDAWSSIHRIQEYLLTEEIKDVVQVDLQAQMALDIRDADFTWERTATPETRTKISTNVNLNLDNPDLDKIRTNIDQVKGKLSIKNRLELSTVKNNDDEKDLISERNPFQLQNINLSVKRNELVAVIGGVGSGKSSLLAAIAGDMRKIRGDLKLGANRAYCPQSAWIQNTSVRENILFGSTMQEDWYNQVLNACSLKPDLELLPQGDMTEIGERGVTISGGQKQRINIARAIYFDADLILLDDPLSAVDAHVGRYVFDKAILQLMKNKSRILATHQLWVLSECDRIVWMEKGRVREVDTYENLMKDNEEFRILLDSTTVEKKDPTSTDHQNQNEAERQLKTDLTSTTIMESEERAKGSIPWSVYSDYIRSSGSMFTALITFFFLIASQSVNIITNLWVSWWSIDYFGYTRQLYIGVYVALGAIQALLSFSFSLSVSLFCTISSKRIINRAITRVLRAPMSFFDTTPLGRITNRFSGDIDVLDNQLTEAIRVLLLSSAMILSVFSLISAFFPYFIVALIPIFFLFKFSSSYYRASAKQLKRIESILRSHVFAKFNEGLSGTACIRAYGHQNYFITKLQKSLDDMNGVYFLNFANQRWSSIRIDTMAIFLVFVIGMLIVTSRFEVKPSIAGLVLSFILSIIQVMQYFIRQLAEVESGMNSVEHLYYYGTSLEEEAPLHTFEIQKSWPETGEIIFQNVYMQYRADLPFALCCFNLHIRSGERLGIVGRTGAGKSSIMTSLFRLVEISAGSIIIDNIDISTIGLHDLRSRLAIIPQDPCLFKGTIRSNLDPFSEFTDLELWSALRQSGLILPPENTDADNKDRIHLNSVVDDEGSNFSLGQRQLMALARALVRKSQIIVCDEATSSVDMETDSKIQQTMVQAFKGKTLLCIAHRLRTIINYDRICVLERGNIVELDTPKLLWEKGGIFKSMCDKSGISRGDFDLTV